MSINTSTDLFLYSSTSFFLKVYHITSVTAPHTPSQVVNKLYLYPLKLSNAPPLPQITLSPPHTKKEESTPK